MRSPAADNFPAELPRGSAGPRLELSEVRPNSLRCALRRGEGAPQPPSPDQLRPGIPLLPTLRASARLRGPRHFLRAPRARPLGAAGARGRRPVRFWIASRSPSAPLGAPSPGRARSRVQAQAGEQGSRRGWAEFGRRASPRAAGGEGCASAQPARLPACALQGDRPEPPASSGGPVSAGAGCAPLQPRRRSRSRRRGRGARRVRVGCWGAIGPRALLRSSASYLGKVKLLTHRKPFRPLRALCSQS